MSHRTREKNFWRRYGITNPKKAPETWTTFGAPHGELTDEDLDFFTRKVKVVDVVILDENEVTAEGIKFLTRLEVVRELDLKNMTIDDNSVHDILKLQNLEWLQIRGTRISTEGIETILAGLKDLKTLVISEEQVEKEFGEALQMKYPDTELMIF